MRSTTGGFFAVVVVIGTLVAVAAACSSGTKAATTTSTTLRIPHATETTAPTPTRPRASLEFREVESSNDSPLIVPARERACSTRHLVSVASGTVLFDRKHQYCYFVGRVLLTGAGIASATVVYDSNASTWSVNVRWSNNDFLKKIAQPLVNKQVAIVVKGVVQSAPVINLGIEGQDVLINTGTYTRAQAVEVAASIMGIAASQVPVDANGSPADVCNAMNDAARAASAVFYANNGGAYPKTFSDMEKSNPPTLELPKDVTGTRTVLTGNGWKLTMTGGGGSAPTFTCSA
jgi:hypothetical protein